MSTQSYWRRQARVVIDAAIAESQALGLDTKATTRHIDAAYPFGPRECHPYKMWLVERKIALARLNRPGVKPTISSADMEILRAWNEGNPL